MCLPLSTAAFTGSMAAVNPTNPSLAVGLATIAAFGIGGVIVPPATIAVSPSSRRVLIITVQLYGLGGFLSKEPLSSPVLLTKLTHAEQKMTACPDSLIATATALTLTIRFVGGSIGYS